MQEIVRGGEAAEHGPRDDDDCLGRLPAMRNRLDRSSVAQHLDGSRLMGRLRIPGSQIIHCVARDKFSRRRCGMRSEPCCRKPVLKDVGQSCVLACRATDGRMCRSPVAADISR